jgi:hypothetical protein
MTASGRAPAKVANVDDVDEIMRCVRQRIAELDARRQCLNSRFEEFAARSADDDALGRARRFALQALHFARSAHRCNLNAHAQVARVHDDAARVHDRTADAGIGDVAWHRGRAEHHRIEAGRQREFAGDGPIRRSTTIRSSLGQETPYDRR